MDYPVDSRVGAPVSPPPGRDDGAWAVANKGETEALLLHYWQILKKRKLVVGMFCFFLVTTVTIATLLSTPFYAATTVIQISPKAPTVVEMDQVADLVSSSGAQDVQNYYATQYKIIQSRSVLSTALTRLKEQHAITDFDEAEKPLEALRRILIVEPVPQTHLVNITVEFPDPDKARLFADTVAEAYMDNNRQRALTSTQEALAWLREQAEKLRQRKYESDRAVGEYKSQHDLGGVNEQYNSTLTQLRSLQERWSAAHTEVVEAQSIYQELESQLRTARATSNYAPLAQHLAVGRPTLNGLLTHRDELLQQRAELASKYVDAAPQIREVDGQIAGIESQIHQQVNDIIASRKADADVLATRERNLKTELDASKSQAKLLEEKFIELKFLEGKAERDESFYKNIDTRLNEVDLSSLLQNNNIQIIDRAVPTDDPIRPVLPVNLAMALLFGLAGGCAMAFAIEHFDSTIKSQDDIEQLMGVALLGVVPEVDPAESRSLPNDVDRSLYVFARPRSNIAEHLRSIRTNVMFRTPKKPTRRLLITSAAPREGKSFTSSNLAAIIAMTGNRVLLIDADLRRPALHKRFGMTNDRGLRDALADGASFDSVRRHTHIPDLDVIVAGPPPQNPGELLSSQMAPFLAGIEGYDFILVDSPPVTVVADPLVLSNMVDGVLIVVEANRTDRNMVIQSFTRLREMKANIIGAIMNKLSARTATYGYYNYYSYGYYYADGEGEGEAQGAPREPAAR